MWYRAVGVQPSTGSQQRERPLTGLLPICPGTGPAQRPRYLWFPESSLFSYLRAFVHSPAAPCPSFNTAPIKLVFKCCGLLLPLACKSHFVLEETFQNIDRALGLKPGVLSVTVASCGFPMCQVLHTNFLKWFF